MKKKKASLKGNYIQTINEVLKGEIFPFYVLVGENFYLKKQLIEKIKTKLKVEKINIIDGDTDKKSIFNFLETPNFFSSSLIFYIRYANKIENFKWEDFNSRKNRIIIFEDREKSLPEPPIYLEDKVKYVIEIPIDEGILKKWVIKKFEEYGKSIDDRAVSKLIYQLQNDIDLLYSEIEKLSNIDKNILNEEDIDFYTYKINIPNIFELISSYLKKRKRKFLKSINDLIESGEQFEKIFYILLNRIINLIDIKVALIFGLSDKLIKENIKLSQNQISNLIDEAKEYSFEELYELLNKLLEIEKRIKLSKGFIREKLELSILEN